MAKGNDRARELTVRNSRAMRQAVRDFKSQNPPPKKSKPKKGGKSASFWKILFG